jgi:Fe(3+) dicitrate transport protein
VDVDGDAWRARVEGFYGQMRRLAGQGEYVASDSTDSYFVLNLSAEYEIANGARLFASAQNVADNVHIEARHPAGVRPGLPRLIQAGLKISLAR